MKQATKVESATALERLASWCAALDWPSVPEAERARVPLRVLDTAGLILAGAATAATRAVVDHVHAQGGIGTASALLGGRRLPPAQAALVHGVAAHCRDYDDTFPDSVVHPGSMVVAAALAAGEGASAAPADIGCAILAGYEVAARLGSVAGRRFHARGLHATGIVGPIAAAAAAARATRLDARQTAWALGLAASMSGGLMAFQADGAWSKWLHVGWAAHGGVIAADLAGRGFRGPASALDGPGNLFDALLAGEALDRDVLSRGLGHDWRGGAARFKIYPCAHVIQPYIDAALALRARHGLDPNDIAEVRCPIAPWAVPIVCEPRAPKLAPETELDAIASLPYMVAAALADGRMTLDVLGAPMRERGDLRALAARVVHVADETMGHGFDARIEIRLAGGGVYEAAADAAVPEAERLHAKFVANAAARMGAVRARAAAARLAAMPVPDIAAIAEIFAPGVPAPP